MCIFSGHVEQVAATQIFARRLPGRRQALIYSMEFASAGELAMVLPLPVPPGSREGAVEFVDLSAYPELFSDLKRAFPEPVLRFSPQGPIPGGAPAALEVVRVGEFEASFVPRVADFERLDQRFRLDASVWRELPQYTDFGFAVFKLRPGVERQRVHPMAFTFPHRHAYSVFIPTLHVHDGVVSATANFDHTLYVQPPPELRDVVDWRRSELPLASVLDASRLRGLVDLNAPAQRLRLLGSRHNQDVQL